MSPADLILLVEDDSTDALLLRRAFEKAGVANPLQVISDGEQAVAYLSGQGVYGDRARHPLPSLVILDIMLPRRSGFEVLTWMRQDPALRSLPVIMLTSSGEPRDISRAYDTGANAYHVKPSGFRDLLEFVEAIKAYWLTWTEPLVGISEPRTDKTGGDDDAIFPRVTDLTNQVVSEKSKVYALLSRHPDGLTPEELARAFLSRGLAGGAIEAVTERIEDILRRLETGPLHRRVVRTGDGHYRAVAFWS